MFHRKTLAQVLAEKLKKGQRAAQVSGKPKSVRRHAPLSLRTTIKRSQKILKKTISPSKR